MILGTCKQAFNDVNNTVLGSKKKVGYLHSIRYFIMYAISCTLQGPHFQKESHLKSLVMALKIDGYDGQNKRGPTNNLECLLCGSTRGCATETISGTHLPQHFVYDDHKLHGSFKTRNCESPRFFLECVLWPELETQLILSFVKSESCQVLKE